MEKFKEIYDSLQKSGFKFLLFAIIGIVIGVFGSAKYFSYKMNDSIKLGGFIYDNIIYDIKVKQ